jgi:putative N6-adenine-specific DNA methylase
MQATKPKKPEDDMLKKGTTYSCVAKTMAGMEDILIEELESLGISEIEKVTRAVTFTTDMAGIYRVNYWSRFALRVLVDIHQYKAFDEKRLHSKAMQFPWETLLDPSKTFAIDSAVHSELHTHSHFASLRVKDAIADYFVDKVGTRPDVDLENPDVRIHVHIEDQEVQLAVDSSGESLHKRGYRSKHFEAPLNEVLAAGMIKLSGWTRDQVFWDPMCGSGTLICEAAMMANGIAPQVMRQRFGFMNWEGFDAKLWEEIKQEKHGHSEEKHAKIYGSDLNLLAVNVAAEHLKNLGLYQAVKLKREDFLLAPRHAPSGIIVINPPYGVRLEKMDVDKFYEDIANRLKHHLTGWQAWIFTSNAEAMKSFGLKHSKKLRLFNGGLECTFRQYEVFEGKRKEFLEDGV